jgi:lipoate-protein ligase B
MQVLNLGRRDYKEVWDLQKTIHHERVDNRIPNTLILVEHDPVITLGKSGRQDNVLFPVASLESRGLKYYEIERGGDVTFHGPGQLVGYPIFNVKEGLTGIKPFIERIEDAIIETVSDFGINAYKREKFIGVWTEKGKICSIGIAVKRWVSFHGFALNVNTDLEYFDLIVPCGLKNVEMTSMQQILGRQLSMDEVRETTIERFGSIFHEGVQETCLEEII